MAQRGRPIDGYTLQAIKRLARDLPIKQVARETGTSKNTVKKYTREGK